MERKHRKKIFCIEGNWNPRLSDRASVRPVLELLEINSDVGYIYKDCSTEEELYYLLERWQQKSYADYKILYMAFHGEPGRILIDTRHKIGLDQLGKHLCCRTHRRIIYFGACSVMRIDKRVIKRFMKAAGIKVVCGYTTDVDWIPSTALDLIAMNELQRFSTTR